MNAVRTDAGEDRTVPHTVPLRGGAMQRHTCAFAFNTKSFLLQMNREIRLSSTECSSEITYMYICEYIYMHTRRQARTHTNTHMHNKS